VAPPGTVGAPAAPPRAAAGRGRFRRARDACPAAVDPESATDEAVRDGAMSPPRLFSAIPSLLSSSSLLPPTKLPFLFRRCFHDALLSLDTTVAT
jgi:hypothetical protein